ncbi:MAG: hypothetical protein ACOC5E_03605 [Acidobacteriota bacterium]
MTARREAKPPRTAIPLLALAVSLAAAGAAIPGERTAAIAPERPFAMGFSPFPHRLDSVGILDALDRIAEDADLALIHEDGGVPWPEALHGRSFPTAWQELLDLYAASVPERHRLVLAITPLDDDRDDLALRRGDAPQQPLPPPWDERALGHPKVIRAFIRYSLRMIDQFHPDWFLFAVEANMLHAQAPERWPGFVRLARRTYRAVKRRHPDLPVGWSLQAEFFHGDPEAQAEAIDAILPFTDLLAISTYAFGNVGPDANPRHIPPDYFRDLADLAPDRPFAVAETAWPAEDLDDPFPGHIAANPRWQARYVRRLMREARDLDAAFVAWFFSRDYDDAWEEAFQFLELAPRLRIWRDTGLYAGDGTPRLALRAWRRWLRRGNG